MTFPPPNPSPLLYLCVQYIHQFLRRHVSHPIHLALVIAFVTTQAFVWVGITLATIIKPDQEWIGYLIGGMFVASFPVGFALMLEDNWIKNGHSGEKRF